MKEKNDDLFEFLGLLSKAIKETEEKHVFEHNFSFPMEITGIKRLIILFQKTCTAKQEV